MEQAIRKYMKDYMDLWLFSGAIHVAQRGQVIISEAYGKACIELDVPNSVETRFSLASVSKQFTAYATMQLYDNGAIDIDRPINDYLPDELHVDARITVHHCLSHTSGLPLFHGTEQRFFGEEDKTNYDRARFVSNFRDEPLMFEPGSGFAYCNAGFHLLAYMIEHVSGMKFKRYLTERLFTPLGLADTVFDDGSEILRGKAFGYGMNGDDFVPGEYHNAMYSIGAGGVVSNCSDLYRWYTCLRNREGLSDRTYERFFQENRNGFSYGLMTDRKRGTTRYYHDGAYSGIGTFVEYNFENDSCIIVLSNFDVTNVIRIGNAVADILDGSVVEVPRKPPAVVLDEELARKYEGVYVPGRAELRRIDGRWEFLHLGRIRKPIYPIGNHKFHRTWIDHSYTLIEDEDGEFMFLGFKKEHSNDRI